MLITGQGEGFQRALSHVKGTCGPCRNGRPCKACRVLPCPTCEAGHQHNFDDLGADGIVRCANCGVPRGRG